MLGCHRLTCLNYRCVRWQRALMSFSSCLPKRRHGKIAWVGGGEERRRATFPQVCLQYTRLQRGCLSTRTSGCHALLSPPFRSPLLALTSQGSLLFQAGSVSCTQHPKFHLLWARRMPVKLWGSTPRDYTAALSTHPQRHPVKTSTCKPTLFAKRTLHFISIKVNKP